MLAVNIDQFSYHEDEMILKDVHFSVNQGEIVGLIGENGAGKSTTIKMILGLNDAPEDAVTIANDRTLGYIPERPIIYEEMTLWEHIELCAAAYGMQNWETEARRVLRLFKLQGREKDYPKDFSKGMQQKVMLTLAYLPRPDMYVIDEPIMGLDPVSIKIILNVLQEEKERGAGILMCTHALDTAEKYCDRLVILADQTIKFQGDLDELKGVTGQTDGDLLDCFTTLLDGDHSYDA